MKNYEIKKNPISVLISKAGSKEIKKVNILKKNEMLSQFQSQFKAKQSVKKSYGQLSEKTYKKLTKLGHGGASKGPQQPLLCVIEKRLDVVLFRLGFARTILEARSLIKGGFVKVDGECAHKNSFGWNLKIGSSVAVAKSDLAYFAKISSLKNNYFPLPSHLAYFTPVGSHRDGLSGSKSFNEFNYNTDLIGYLIKNPEESEIFNPIVN